MKGKGEDVEIVDDAVGRGKGRLGKVRVTEFDGIG